MNPGVAAPGSQHNRAIPLSIKRAEAVGDRTPPTSCEALPGSRSVTQGDIVFPRRNQGMQSLVVLLKAERDKVVRQLKGLNAALAAFAGSYSDGATRPRRRRRLSAQGLANIRAAQRARWAKGRRASGGASNNAPKRSMSKAARARIAAAQRARWAKVKAGKKG